MAQSFYTINLQKPDFPMLSEQQARTIIGNTAGEAPSKEQTPSIAYCHNVMPSKYGYDSVGYLKLINAASTLVLSPDKSLIGIKLVYGNNKSRVYLAWDNIGGVYALAAGSSIWVALPSTVPATGGVNFSLESVTVGTVNGVSYIYYSKIGAFTYNEGSKKLDSVTLIGISTSTTLGLVASSGYLIVYTDLAIAWSSTIDPTDFVPSEVTGAGGGNVAGTAGSILFITSNTLGLLVATAANTLAGTYTGNIQFPFKFREVEDSEGGISLDTVAKEANGSNQFIYSKAGLQRINSRRAENILPEVTDFLAGRRLEDYDEATKSFIFTAVPSLATMKKKVRYISSRYIIISYGIAAFTHAIVADTALNKLGKLKINHVDCFEYIGSQSEVSKESIAFLLSTGEIQVLDFSAATTTGGVLILGKLQQVRGKLITLLGVDVENIVSGDTLSVTSLLSFDGKTLATEVVGTLDSTGSQIREYLFRTTALSHSLVFTGKFNLVTAEVRFISVGKR